MKNGANGFLGAATEMLAAGLCVVPANANKHPTMGEWKDYQQNLPVGEEIEQWFHERRPFGLGFVCGLISGGLEVLDLDAKHDPTGTLNARAEVAIREYAPGLWERMVIEKTPSGGLHLYFRCALPAKNLKLARCLNTEGKPMAVAETRGEGGFIMAAPSPGYVIVQGKLTEPPLITDDERAALFAAARSLDTLPAQQKAQYAKPPPSIPKARTGGPPGFISPGDAYNASEDWRSLIQKHGWTEKNEHQWARPGKTNGSSATWDTLLDCPRHLYVFTPNAHPLEEDENYSPFRLFAALECGGDFKVAADRLYELGYGTRKKPKPSAPDADEQARIDAENEACFEESQLTEEAIVKDDAKPSVPNESGPKPFTLWAPSQFLAYTPDPSSVLLGTGYLELGQWTSFIGIGGLGKTRLALWLVICQMLKKVWCGIPTGGVPQKSVILSTENGLKRWQEDLKKVLGTLSDDEGSVVESHLRILAMTDEEDGDICLGNLLNVARLQATLKEASAGIVVLDPFADLMDGDENKTVDLVATLTLLRSITRTSCPKAAVLIIHHGRTGSANVAQAGDNFNAGNFGRGAKALFSKVRCELQLAPEDRDNPDRLVLACGKANDTVKFAPRCIVFNPDDFTYRVDPNFDIDAWRADVTGNRKKSSVSIADLVEAVHEKCPLPGDEIATNEIFEEFEASGVTKRTLQRLVVSAVKEGYLRIGKKRFMLRLGVKPLERK